MDPSRAPLSQLLWPALAWAACCRWSASPGRHRQGAGCVGCSNGSATVTARCGGRSAVPGDRRALNAVMGIPQVWTPGLVQPWGLASAIPGRPVGFLRQPNHLSSLLPWGWAPDLVGPPSDRHRDPAQRDTPATTLGLFLAVYLFLLWVVDLTGSRTGAVGTLIFCAGLPTGHVAGARRLSPSPRCFTSCCGRRGGWDSKVDELRCPGAIPAARHVVFALQDLARHLGASSRTTPGPAWAGATSTWPDAHRVARPPHRLLRPLPQHRAAVHGRAGHSLPRWRCWPPALGLLAWRQRFWLARPERRDPVRRRVRGVDACCTACSSTRCGTPTS